jgi:hypothetical protein
MLFFPPAVSLTTLTFATVLARAASEAAAGQEAERRLGLLEVAAAVILGRQLPRRIDACPRCCPRSG